MSRRHEPLSTATHPLHRRRRVLAACRLAATKSGVSGLAMNTPAARHVETMMGNIGPGAGVRIKGPDRSGKSVTLDHVVKRLERTGHTVFLILALRTHRNIPYAAVSRLDLHPRRGHPVIRLADNLTAQITARRRPVLAVDDFHHVDAHSLAVLEDVLRRSACPIVITTPDTTELSGDHLAVLGTRALALVSTTTLGTSPQPSGTPLTPRESEICALVPSLTNSDIAARLHISVRTVENHISNALRKTGLLTRSDLGELITGANR